VKPVLDWIKGHMVVVVSAALIVVSLPTAYVISSGWATSVRESQLGVVREQDQKVSNLEVTYVVPPATPDADPVERRYVPNEAYIERFRSLLDAQAREQQRVVSAALAFNRHTPLYLPDPEDEPGQEQAETDGDKTEDDAGEGTDGDDGPVGVAPSRPQSEMESRLERELLGGRVEVPPHEVVIAGLLPEPGSSTLREELTLEFVRRFSGIVRGDGLSMHERLLTDLAGDGGPSPMGGLPPDPDVVARSLDRVRQQYLEGLGPRPDSGREPALSEDEKRELETRLREHRLGLYSTRAGEISFYIDPAILRTVNAQAPVPNAISPIPLWAVFEITWDYWVLKDVLSAIADANTNDRGRRLDVPQGVVKRVESITIEPLAISRVPGDDGPRPPEGRHIAANRPSQPDRNGLIGTWEGWSLTGRLTHPGNDLYDVRPVTMSLVVDSRRIPELFASLSRTNFMTVLDMDVERVDEWEHLREGYFYGESPVVRVSLTIETVWLREWTAPMMPARVRRDLGVRENAGGGAGGRG